MRSAGGITDFRSAISTGGTATPQVAVGGNSLAKIPRCSYLTPNSGGIPFASLIISLNEPSDGSDVGFSALASDGSANESKVGMSAARLLGSSASISLLV